MKRTEGKSQIKIGIVLNYLNTGLGSLIPIFYTPVMLALLGQNEYGLYKLSSSVTSYLSLISLGIGSAVTRYLIKARTEEGEEAEAGIFGLFMIIFQIIAVAAVVIGSLLCLNLDLWYGQSLSADELGRMQVLVFIMVCNMALGFSVSPYLSVVNAHEKFIFLQCMNILSTCVAPVLNLLVLFMGYASIGMAVSSLLLSMLTRVFYFLYVRKCCAKPSYQNLPTHLLKEILSFSFWIFVANVVSQLYNATDTVMIGAVPALGTSGVAVYNIGATFTSIVSSLTTGASNLLAPKTNKMVFGGASNRELTDLAIRVGRLQCFIVMLMVTGFIAFGRCFIRFYAGEGYEESYWVAVFVMIPNMIPLVQSVCLSIIVAQNRHRFRSLVCTGIAVMNVIGTWILMNLIGVVGAALATGVALIIGQGFVMNWYYATHTGLEIGRFWKEVGKIYVMPIGMCVITWIVSRFVNFENVLTMLIGIVLYTVVYCVLNYKWVMNEYERSMVTKPLKTIMGKLRKTA